jgi:biopolymer transport protein ExbD
MRQRRTSDRADDGIGSRPQPGGSQGESRAGRVSRWHPSSMRYTRRGGGLAMSLNLTPMIDVVFLLLLFFLTASRFRGNEGMLPGRLPAPTAAAVVEIPRTPIRVRFQQSKTSPDECQVTIDRFRESPALPIGELGEALRRIQQSQPGFDSQTPIHLMAGDGIRWDHVVNAYNAALAARYEKVFFATPR